MKIVFELEKEKGSSMACLGRPLEVIYRRKRIPLVETTPANYGDIVSEFAGKEPKPSILIVVPNPRGGNSYLVFFANP